MAVFQQVAAKLVGEINQELDKHTFLLSRTILYFFISGNSDKPTKTNYFALIHRQMYVYPTTSPTNLCANFSIEVED